MFVTRTVAISTRNWYGRFYHTTISDVFKVKRPGDTIKIKGWVKSLRKQKDYAFFDVNDGTHIKRLQVVAKKDQTLKNLTSGASVIVSGNLAETPSGQLELNASAVSVVGECDVRDGYPFAPRKIYPPEYTRKYLHFRPRTKRFSSLLKIRDVAHLEIHNYLHSKDFIQVHTPILTSNDCEGAGEVFSAIPTNKDMLNNMIRPNVTVDQAYFGCETYLSVSGQMHLEAAAHGLSKVYSFGPTFRAENSRSRYHLSEFYMLEAEMAFINKLETLLNTIEMFIKCVSFKIFDKCAEEIAVCKETDHYISSHLIRDFKVLPYDEVVNILKKYETKFQKAFNEKDGLTKEHEIFLVAHCQSPVFIINFPKTMKPFYMKELTDDQTKVAAVDLLGPNVGEIIGGSLRENDYYKLKNSIPGNDARLDWYLDLRRFGSVPTAGFGMGFERFLQSIVGIANIKDTIPFPRWPHHCQM
ncbi:asparaginyl-tRNA synthetase [Onthophagus taurus]|uniref:asparaginyl-tRNA synthetase n=1 Tax=Onthophagus taurus TaxID=166361 RepID=UPI000C1FF814|nr:probable asparagine--tRNA ligase, mitochondrial [Onthophagus taurus]